MPKITKPQHHSMELQFHPKAEMAIEYFSPFRQKTIWKAIEVLQEVLQQEGIKTLQIHKLIGLNNVFMTRVNIDLRILFSLFFPGII